MPNPIEPPDTSDLEALEDLKRSPGYKLTQKAMLMEIERRRGGMESPTMSHDGVQFARGYIAGLRMVLGLPEALYEEISKEIPKEV